ncbi:hypothetical protein BDZ89DRAFT_994837 [Hymenopellis radicata]|nr:hypothetical protein BDZ89DRAFT_994837 [Hymenopellis radicata]
MTATFTDEEINSLFDPAPPPAYDTAPTPHLNKLVAVPQVKPSFDAPFIRAYPPSLQECGISVEDWMDFCDGLNIAMIGSPPLAVVDKVGMVIGFVPNHWTMIAAMTIQVSAQTGMRVISKNLTDKYLIRANETFFGPRGLRVRLCKTPAMRALASPSTPQPSTLAKVGKTAQSIGLHLPVVRKVINRFADPVPQVDPYSPTDAAGRRIAAFQAEGIIADLDYNVPPPKKAEGIMDKMNEMGIKAEQWKAARTEKKTHEKRQRLAMVEQGGGSKKDNRLQHRNERRAARGRRVRKTKLQTRVEIADRKEYSVTDNLVWIVILDATHDATIEGREIADSREALEVDADEWEDEIELEHDEEDERHHHDEDRK